MRAHPFFLAFTACCLLLLLPSCGYTQPAGTTTIATYTPSANNSGIPEALVWSPDGTRIATAYSSGYIEIWQATTGKRLLVYSRHKVSNRTQGLYVVAWSPDGTRIASTGDYPAPSRHDQTMQIFDAATGKMLLTYQGNYTSMCCVSWSTDGKRLLLSDYATVFIIDASTGKSSFSYMYEDCQGEAGIQGGSLSALAWSPNDQYIAMGACEAAVWQIQ